MEMLNLHFLIHIWYSFIPEEGFSQPPALRIIDSDNQLHVVTICGGTIGSSNECDIRIKCGVFEVRFLSVQIIAKAGEWRMNIMVNFQF